MSKSQIINFDSYYARPTKGNYNPKHPMSLTFDINQSIFGKNKVKAISLQSVEWTNYIPNIRAGVNDFFSISMANTIINISLGTQYCNNITTFISILNVAINNSLTVLNTANGTNWTLIVSICSTNTSKLTLTSNRIFNFNVNSILLSNIMGFYADTTFNSLSLDSTTYYNLNIDNYYNFNIANFNSMSAHGSVSCFKLPINSSATGETLTFLSSGFAQTINYSTTSETGIYMSDLQITITDRFDFDVIGILPFDLTFSLEFDFSE